MNYFSESINTTNNQASIYPKSPPSFVPRRQNNNFHGGLLRIPHTIIITGFYPKNILSSIQISVTGNSLSTHILPVIIEAFQNIGVLIIFQRFKVKGRKLKGKNVLVCSKNEFFSFQNIFLKWRVFLSSNHGFIEQLNASNINGRYFITFFQTIGMKYVHAPHSTKKHFTAFALCISIY